MKAKIKNILFLVILLASVALGMSSDVTNFKLLNLRNQQVELAKLLKDGPVLLDFWATWCKPCLKGFPKLNALHKKYGEKGLTVVGINEDGARSQSKVKPFVRSLRIKFPVLIDSNNEVMRKLQVQVLPTTILIAPNGMVVARHVGYSPDGMKKLEERIVTMLRESANH